ncbi:MAG: beta-lactamase family protein [Saprospiraceae bacterium]|nr:beta-lactamase family protein [Saprospiraceae bacterium]
MKNYFKPTLGICLLALTPLLAIAQTDMATRLDNYLKRAEAAGYTGSVLVADGGKVILAKGYGMADPEAGRRESDSTFFSIGSITKQFTGAAILKLEMQGKLKVTDPLSKFFPQAPSDKASITLHQLLTHGAGFPGAIGDDYELLDARAFADRAMQTKLLFEPGKGYEYSNVGYSLLGIIVEMLSGQSYEQYLSQHIFKPAGMNHTGYLLPEFKKEQLGVGYRDGERWGTALDHPWLPDGPGWHLRANGGIISNVHDMYKWYLALQKDKVLSEEAREKYFAPHNREGQADSHYGYGWVIMDLPEGRFIQHNGGNGVYNAFMGFFPSLGRCIIASSNANNKISDDIAMRLNAYLTGNVIEADPEQLRKWTGTYKLPSGQTFDLQFDENDQLQAFFENRDAMLALTAEGNEDPAATKAADARTQAILEGIFKQDYAPLAQAFGESEAEVKERAHPYWQGLQQQFGSFQSLFIMGTVNRSRLGLELTFSKIHFERGALYRMFIWEGERLNNVRDMKRPDKVYDYQGNATFASPNTPCSLHFHTAPNGDVMLTIGYPNWKMEAVKE